MREPSGDRPPGASVRLRLTLSYAGFLLLAGALLLAAVWAFLLRGTPGEHLGIDPGDFARVFQRGNFGPAIFVPAAIEILAFLLVFGLVGGWLLAGRMLAPLDRITEATRVAATGALDHRIRLPGRQDEFRELADAVDTMLARLEAHVGEHQRFAAAASHELRTPLAITRALLDVAACDPDRDADELVARLRAVNTRAIALTEALLLLSRADRRSFARECVDLSLVAEEAVETLVPLAAEHGVTVEITGDPTPVVGSPALLQQLATNLLHNAIVHNIPEHGTVRMRAGVRCGGAELTVENTGEQLDPRAVATFTEPFRRGTDRLRSDHAGLGLAIVAGIVAAHDGTVTLAPLDAGGLRVTVCLPPGAPSERGA